MLLRALRVLAQRLSIREQAFEFRRTRSGPGPRAPKGENCFQSTQWLGRSLTLWLEQCSHGAGRIANHRHESSCHFARRANNLSTAPATGGETSFEVRHVDVDKPLRWQVGILAAS